DRPEDLTDEIRRIPADLPGRHLRGREQRAQIHRPDRNVHSRSARPVSERNTSSSETGTTSTCWMVAPALRAASTAAGTKSRAEVQCAVTASVPLCRSLRAIDALLPR